MGLREVNRQAEWVYREVRSTGVPVTITDRSRLIVRIVPIRHDKTWHKRVVREGKVHQAAGEQALSARRWGTSEGFGLEQFLLGEREEDR